MEARLKLYSGVLVGCRNKRLLEFPKTTGGIEALKSDLRKLVEKAGFGVVNVHIDDFGPESGPGVTVVLKESHLLGGGWPETGKFVDFLIYFCELGENNNDAKAMLLAELLREFCEAEHIYPSLLTPNGPVLVNEIPPRIYPAT